MLGLAYHFFFCVFVGVCDFFVFHLAEVIPQCFFIMCQPGLKLRHTAIPSVQRKHKTWCLVILGSTLNQEDTFSPRLFLRFFGKNFAYLQGVRHVIYNGFRQ